MITLSLQKELLVLLLVIGSMADWAALNHVWDTSDDFHDLSRFPHPNKGCCLFLGIDARQD